jgi:hypothetical protein
MKQWPKIGSKIKFKGVHLFWYTNIINDADKNLEIGKEYTVHKLELASSWCGVRVEEMPGLLFALSFFEYEKDLTTEEVTKISKAEWESEVYEHLTLKELRDKAIKVSDSMVDDCETHSEILRNTRTPEDTVKFMETSDKIQELISGYNVEVDKIIKAFDGKLKKV